MRRLSLAICLAIPLLLGASSAGAAPNDYGKPESWICLPGREDACSKPDLAVTAIAADGRATRKEIGRNPDAPVDCIYLYPTASEDPTGNSDMVAGDGELGAATFHLGPFREVCRTFAPLYRSATLAAVMGGRATTPVDRELAYLDVRDAWRHYLAQHNHGRGFILLGHSQGAGLWARLISEEIDGQPVAAKLVSALLLGPPGRGGGGFKSVPPCERKGQLGCFIAYSAFRASAPPTDQSMFGRVGALHPTVGCVNPAALAGGEGVLHPYLPAWSLPPGANWVRGGLKVDTMFVTTPGLLTAECVRRGQHHYLAVTVHGDPADPRTDEVALDMVYGGKVIAEWGLHGMDPNLAMGDLVGIVSAQARAFEAERKR